MPSGSVRVTRAYHAAVKQASSRSRVLGVGELDGERIRSHGRRHPTSAYAVVRDVDHKRAAVRLDGPRPTIAVAMRSMAACDARGNAIDRFDARIGIACAGEGPQRQFLSESARSKSDAAGAPAAVKTATSHILSS